MNEHPLVGLDVNMLEYYHEARMHIALEKSTWSEAGRLLRRLQELLFTSSADDEWLP